MDADCGESDMDDNSTPLSQFNVLDENKETVVSICASNINDIKFFLGLK